MARVNPKALTIDYKNLMRATVTDRVNALRGGLLNDTLFSLTPTEYARLFPKYYLERASIPTGFADAMRGVMSGGTPIRGPSGGTDGSARPYTPEQKAPPKVTVAEMKTKLLEKGVDIDKTLSSIGKEGLPEGDERLKYLKNLSSDQLAAAGLQKVQNENGETVIKRTATAAETMTDEQAIEKYQKEFPTSGFTPREEATLKFIAKREGSQDPNVIFGDSGNQGGTGKYSRALGLDKRPLTDHSISEVLDMQKNLTAMTARDGVAGGRGTSAIGSGQMVRGTLEGNLRALGIPEDQWGSIKFDENLQKKLTLMNFKQSGIGDPNADPATWNKMVLGKQYESLDVTKGFSPMSPQEEQAIRDSSTIKPAEVANISPEQARQALADQERGRQSAALTEMLYGNERGQTAVAAKGDTNVLSGPTVIDTGITPIAHGDSGTFIARSSRDVQKAGINNIDPRLVTLGDAAIRSFEKMNPGYTVRVISGKRTPETNSGSATSRHLQGGAVDYEIIDPQGKALPNLGARQGTSAGFSVPKYEELGRYMEAARVKLAKDDPRYAEGPVVSGAYFGGDFWMDSMHMQIGGNSALGNLYTGFKSPEQLRAEGQPEHVVRAVRAAIEAGSGKSYSQEEMQQLSSFLYENGVAPSSVIAKVNPAVAAQLEQKLAQASTPNATPQGSTPAPSITPPSQVTPSTTPTTTPTANTSDIMPPASAADKAIEGQSAPEATPAAPAGASDIMPPPSAADKAIEAQQVAQAETGWRSWVPFLKDGGEVQGENLAIVNKASGEMVAHSNDREGYQFSEGKIKVIPEELQSKAEITNRQEEGFAKKIPDGDATTVTNQTVENKQTPRQPMANLPDTERFFQAEVMTSPPSLARAYAKSVVAPFSAGAQNETR